MLEKLFGFNSKTSTVKTEVMAGVTTFLTMAYILAVSPNILSETGMDKGALFTTTVIMSALPTIFMGLYAKLPLALAPGMGLNAFAATAPVLVLVGLMMMSNIWKIDFFDYRESIPAFICIIFMPLAYSISDGIMLGHLIYVIVNLLSRNRKVLTPGMYILAAVFLLKFLI